MQHPAAKMIVLAAQMQEQEVGDGTNTVIILASSLLEHASELLNMVRHLYSKLYDPDEFRD